MDWLLAGFVRKRTAAAEAEPAVAKHPNGDDDRCSDRLHGKISLDQEKQQGDRDIKCKGVKSTELDKDFSAASAFVAACAAGVPEGPCTASQPSALELKAHAKWNAWNKLGAMPTEEAMEELFPNCADGSKMKDGDTTMSASGSKVPMGPVFSSLMYEEDQGNESELGDIHISAREGAIEDVKKHLAAGVQINIRDSEERTPLHWAGDRGHLDAVEVLVNSIQKKNYEETTMSASGSKGPMGPVLGRNELEVGDIHVSAREGAIDDVKRHLAAGVEVNIRDNKERTPLHLAVDRGHLDAVEVLVNSNADVNAKDNKGQTALHYAVLCEREDIAELLVKHHADLQIKDGDGNTARDLCSSDWPFMKPAN